MNFYFNMKNLQGNFIGLMAGSRWKVVVIHPDNVYFSYFCATGFNNKDHFIKALTQKSAFLVLA